jgi:hypothetical protein
MRVTQHHGMRTRSRNARPDRRASDRSLASTSSSSVRVGSGARPLCLAVGMGVPAHLDQPACVRARGPDVRPSPDGRRAGRDRHRAWRSRGQILNADFRQGRIRTKVGIQDLTPGTLAATPTSPCSRGTDFPWHWTSRLQAGWPRPSVRARVSVALHTPPIPSPPIDAVTSDLRGPIYSSPSTSARSLRRPVCRLLRMKSARPM